MIVEDDDEDWNLSCFMTAEEVEASGLCSKMRALQEKFFSASVELFADMLAAATLAEESLDLMHQATRKQALDDF